MRWCRNRYYLHMVVGSKGSGKSLYMARAANKWYRKRKGEVYSNMGIGYDLPAEYWKVNFPPDSLILIDEVGGRDLVNDIAPAGLPTFYTIPRTADLTQTLGYKTEQIISKDRSKDTRQ